MSTIEILRLVSDVSFLLAALASGRVWMRQRTASAAYLAGTFLSYAAIILASRVLPEDAPIWATLLIVVVLLVSPYLLVRFAGELATISDRARRLVLAGMIVSLAGLALPDVLTQDPETQTTGLISAYTVVALTYWFGAIALAGWVMLRTARRRPGIVGGRLRLLGVAMILLAVTLVVSSLGEEESLAVAISSVITSVAGILFVVGFAPPALLRAMWRAPAEKRIYRAALDTMQVQSRDEVVAVLLPAVRDLVGSVLVQLQGPSGALVAEVGSIDHVRDGSVAHRVAISDHELTLWLDPAMPLFGREDVEAFERLAAVAALALERARLRESEQRALERVEAANGDLQAFVNSTTHDLKNPLFTIRGFIDVMVAGRAGPIRDDARDYLERMRGNVDFMDGLIADLLELSRAGEIHLDPAPVDVGEVVDELANDLSGAYEGLVVEHDGLPVLLVPPARLRQVLSNLLINACVHANRDDVRVSVSAERRVGGELHLFVADNGPGIPREHRESVLRPFHRLAGRAVPGSGLGLAICVKIMEGLGGSIRVDSRTSEAGTVFDLTFPPSASAPSDEGAMEDSSGWDSRRSAEYAG